MTHHCPACQRSFAEPGFCPHDGKPLTAGRPADVPTVYPAPAAPAPLPAHQVPTKPEPHTSPGIGDAGKVRAISAHEGHADAIASMRKEPRRSEYDVLIGQTLDGRYQVQRKIGEGGMGVVFAVRHAVIERPLAIKVLKREVMRDSATIQRFIQEAKAASRIGHPNIVDVTDFGKTPDGLTYSVMEYVDGTTLGKTIKSAAPMAPERAIRVASQIARALAAAHAKGIVHRDLKPDNVFLVDRDGRPDFVKIVDFGIAKVKPLEGATERPRLTQQGAVFGTPEYMAPEQAAGRGDTDHRVDVYALGTILYEMLVGKVPHKGGSMIRTIAMQMLDPIAPPSQSHPELAIPKALEAVVMKALEKKREARYASMTELLAALEAIPLAEPAPSLPLHPPGADPTITPAPGVPLTSSDGDGAGKPRRARPATRPLHEPEFVAPGAPISFTHVDDAPAPEPSRWPMILAGLLMLLLGAGGAILIAWKLRPGEATVAERPVDAAVIAELRDAQVEPPADAEAVADDPTDAGTKVVAVGARDAGVGKLGQIGRIVRPGKGTVTIEVLTRPGDAEIFIGRNYRGPSGTRISERFGAKVKIECKTAVMKGSILVVFDGKLSAVMCTATRDRFCVPGLKNPYDDCEEDPNAPGP